MPHVGRAAAGDFRALDAPRGEQAERLAHETLDIAGLAGGGVGHQSGEDEPGRSCDAGGEIRRFRGRLNAAAPRAGVAFHHHMQRCRTVREGGGEAVHRRLAVGDDGKAGDAHGKRLQPRKLGLAQDVEGDENVVDAGIGHDFGFADLLAGDAARAGLDLRLGEARQLVRLDMRPALEAEPVAMGLEAGDVGERNRLVQHEGGRFGLEGRVGGHGVVRSSQAAWGSSTRGQMARVRVW